jgi:Phd_YefM.
MKTQYSPTAARQNFYSIIKDVNNSKSAIEIIPQGNATIQENAGVAVIPLEDWYAIKESLFLEQAGVMDVVKIREKDESGVTNIDDIDWDEL